MTQVNPIQIIKSIFLIPVIIPTYLLIIFLISNKSEHDQIKDILSNHINIFNSSYIVNISVISNTSNCNVLDKKDNSQEWTELVFGEVEELCDDNEKNRLGCKSITLNTIFNRKVCLLKGNNSYSYRNLIEKYLFFTHNSNDTDIVNKTTTLESNISITNDKLISYEEMSLSNEKRLFSNILQSNVDISSFFHKENIVLNDKLILYEVILINCYDINKDITDLYSLIYNFTEYSTCLYGMYMNTSLIKSFSLLENLIYDIKLNETSYFPYIKTKDLYDSIDFSHLSSLSYDDLYQELSNSQYESLDQYRSFDLYNKQYIKSMFYSSNDFVSLDKSLSNKTKLFLSDFLSDQQKLYMNSSFNLQLQLKKNLSLSYDIEVSLIYSMYPRVVSSVGFIDLNTHLSYFSYITTLENALVIYDIIFILIFLIDLGLIIKRISPQLLIAIEILLVIVSLCLIVSLSSYIQYFEIYNNYIGLNQITSLYYDMYDNYIKNYIDMVLVLIWVLMFFNIIRIVYSLIRLYIGIRLYGCDDDNLLMYYGLIKESGYMNKFVNGKQEEDDKESVGFNEDDDEDRSRKYNKNSICYEEEVELKKNN